MQIEDYFNFLAEDDIRIKGTRIGVESVLYEYIYNGKTPEEIESTFPHGDIRTSLRHNSIFPSKSAKVSAYFADYLEFCREAREEQAKNPSPAVVRLRQLKREKD